MGWGIVAFSSESAAEAYVAAHDGVLTTYTKLQEEIKTGQLDPTQFGDQDHEHEMDPDASSN
jgi:hypothetical protein